MPRKKPTDPERVRLLLINSLDGLHTAMRNRLHTQASELIDGRYLMGPQGIIWYSRHGIHVLDSNRQRLVAVNEMTPAQLVHVVRHLPSLIRMVNDTYRFYINRAFAQNCGIPAMLRCNRMVRQLTRQPARLATPPRKPHPRQRRAPPEVIPPAPANPVEF
jgi:hypothetical protein